MAEEEKIPPVDAEAALDLVLALPAHRSHNTAHAAFGKQILDEYLVGVRARYKDDPVASRYLDDLFAAVVSAVRAFSVERDMFATRWDSVSEIKKADLERAKRIDGYSPFSEGNYWNKAIAILAAGGISVPVVKKIIAETGITSTIAQAPIYLAGLIALSFVLLFVADWLVFRYKATRLKHIEKLYPEEVERVWRQRSMSQYRIILRNFLLTALIIRETHYPHLPSIGTLKLLETFRIPHVAPCTPSGVTNELKPINELYPLLDEIVSRHLAFDAGLASGTTGASHK